MIKTLKSRRNILILLIFNLFFYACKKTDDPTTQTLVIQPAPIDGFVAIKDSSLQNKEVAVKRAKVSDIEDVIAPPAGTAPLTETCDKVCTTFEATVNCSNLCELMKLSQTWEIKAGERFGNKTQQDVCGVTTAGSAFSCYGTGTQKICGYDGKEKAFRLVVNEVGNYRIQLTPIDKSKNFDVFVFKNDNTTTTNNLLDKKKLITSSRNAVGKTETVQLTEKGHYFIIIDEFSTTSSCAYGSFLLSVSPSTDVLVSTTSKDNKFYYEFSLSKTPEGNQLVAWAFRKNQPTVSDTEAVGVVRYPTNCRFSFECSDCDYLVTPVFKNTTTGEVYEGTATLIHP